MYLTYNTEYIWLLHSKYRSHGQHAVWAYRPNILHIYTKTKPTATSTLKNFAKYVPQNKYAHIGTKPSTKGNLHFAEQIWLPHSKYSLHCQHATWAYRQRFFIYAKTYPNET